MKLNRKSLALLLTFSQLALFSCGDNTQKEQETTSDAESETTVQGDGFSIDKTFDGKEVNILLWSLANFNATEETGDVINDAIYRRNSKVEDLLDITFSYDVRVGHGGDYSTWLSTLNSSILAGDDAYQLAGGYGYVLTADTLNDSFMNLSENPYIDFDKPWWPSNILESADLGGKMTVCFGNLDSRYYDTTYAVYFNKRLAENNKLDDLYSLVNDGKWTFDKFAEYSVQASSDIDGDGTLTDNGDIYGTLFNQTMTVDAFINSCDVKITKKNSDGMPELLGLTEKYVDVYDKLYDLIKNSGSVRYQGSSGEENDGIFMNGLSLFMLNSLESAHTLRSMDDDFGIIPYPKYDEDQDSYYTYNAIGNSTAFVVPVTSDETLAGCVIEALAYYGYNDVLPEYYERALKGKGTRDDESAEMLDIIFDNIYFDFTQIYSRNFGDQKAPSMVLRMSLRTDTGIASLWASDENMFNSTMEDLINSLK